MLHNLSEKIQQISLMQIIEYLYFIIRDICRTPIQTRNILFICVVLIVILQKEQKHINVTS